MAVVELLVVSAVVSLTVVFSFFAVLELLTVLVTGVEDDIVDIAAMVEFVSELLDIVVVALLLGFVMDVFTAVVELSVVAELSVELVVMIEVVVVAVGIVIVVAVVVKEVGLVVVVVGLMGAIKALNTGFDSKMLYKLVYQDENL